MKKLVILALLVLSALFAFAGFSRSAKAEVIGQKDASYISMGGISDPVYAEAGTKAVLSTWGTRAVYKDKLHLDGLTVKFASTDIEASGNECLGFIVGSSQGSYFGSGDSITFAAWNGLFGQTRVIVSTNHDYNGGSTAFTNVDCTEQGYIADKQLVMNAISGCCGYIVSFSLVEGGSAYAIKIQAANSSLGLASDVVWGNNPNYNAEDLSTTVYMPVKALPVDENGDVYVAFCGFNSKSQDMTVYMDVEDNNIREYRNTTVKEANEAVDAYVKAVDAILKADANVVMTSTLGTWGDRVSTLNPVKLDGLVVKAYSSTIADNSSLGLAFGSSYDVYFGGGPLAITAWKGLGFAPSQTRICSNVNHDYNAGTSILYTNADCTEQAFIDDGEIVANNPSTGLGYSFSFKAVEGKDCYSVEIAPLNADLEICSDIMWGNNPNYNDANKSSTLYIKKDTISSAMTEAGEIYFAICGFGSTMDLKFQISVNGEILETSEIASMGGSAAVSIDSDPALYRNVITSRYAADGALAGKSGREIAEAIDRMEAATVKLQASSTYNEEQIDYFYESVFELMDDAKYESESDIDDEMIEEIGFVLECIEDKQKYFKSSQSEDTAKEVAEAVKEARMVYETLKAIKAVAAYEAAVDGLDATSETIGEEIKEVKDARATLDITKYMISEAAAETLSARITAADETLALKEEAASVGVKAAYLAAYEATVTEDALSTYAGIKAAFEAYGTLNEATSFTEEDGELLTRYNAAVEAMYSALETLVNNAIVDIDTKLDVTYDTLASFEPVRTEFKSIKLDLLSDDREATAAIKAGYEALKARIESNIWYYVTKTNLASCAQTEDGISFSQTPAFPSRINFNKVLDLSKGTKVTIQVDKYAYFNGDKTEEGASKGANNLSINFLSEANSYKSMSNGLNIIIWLFEVESNVQIMNNKDQAIGSMTLATPIEGGQLVIEVRHGLYDDFAMGETYMAYIITINGNDIVLTEEQVAANGLEISDKCYFSFGSFADTTTDKNAFTLVSIDDLSFGIKQEPIEDPTNRTTVAPTTAPAKTTTAPVVATTTAQAENNNNNGFLAKLGCKSSIGMTLITVIPMIAACGIIISKKRREEF